MVESWSNILLVVLAIIACYLGYSKTKKVSGGNALMLTAVVWSSAILGIAEILDMFQVFPDGTFMADLIYEKEIPVLLLLIWGISSLKNGKK